MHGVHGGGTVQCMSLGEMTIRPIWATAEQKVNKVDIEGHCQAVRLSDRQAYPAV